MKKEEDMVLETERKRIAEFGRKMLEAGLTTGTGGNISIFSREKGLLAITPSSVEYTKLEPENVLVMKPDGSVAEGSMNPSSETGFHLALYARRPDIGSVVHTHSPYAATYACLGREIPAVHYLVGFAGKKVPLAPYATYGSEKLADNISSSIGTFNAVLLANHGLVAVGETLERAFNTAEEIELAARISYQAECIGTPVVLSDDEMERVIEKFKTYGQASNEG
ncbi:MAG: L-fuculose-phosphate aldolase [Desulfobacteraceae bacterium]